VSDEEPVSGRRADDTTMPVVLHRLDAIERRLDQNAKDTSRGFETVRHQIEGLTFVRLDVYAADQNTAKVEHAEIRKDVGDLGTQMKLLWSVVGATVIAGLIGVLFQIASRS
jgi:hypothetical protein